MNIPKKESYENKNPEEAVQFWFNYWNNLYPIESLELLISDENSSFFAYAKLHEKKTVFIKERVNSTGATGFEAARHEHVHHLLYTYGYDFDHTLLFGLVDNALAYAYSKDAYINAGYKNCLPKYHSNLNSIRHYDIHEDKAIKRAINTRLFLTLSKRLSRYSGDISKLLSKASEYAEAIEDTALTKREIRSVNSSINLHHYHLEKAYAGWQKSDDEKKEVLKLNIVQAQKIASLKIAINYLNLLNKKWQCATVVLALATAWLITKI